MGVFSLFRRKAKDTEEAAVTATEPTAQTEAEESGEAKESTEATQPEAEAETKTEVEAEAKAEDEGAESAAETVDAGDDVEIPKQQTADQAADNEAGESARK
ncbi:hypothetical protein OG889_11420 [Streptomyces sp. NBC_00481]|uniref:hypothetical protein n=1 Tax=Streptomyces sp. NBC_00481 TaxID=2975755 RepID=UPI002DD7E513|nr:hypothetical protein [Streptomyces sp. NBC_00481]WRY95287.1 hypothetical protein OG889_11420 [Streptomyces sp. NBC_00481]